MEGVEVKCPDERVNKLQFEQIKESQDKILQSQTEHDTRLRILEENKVQMTSEFSTLKQSQSDHKVLMLDLDRVARENNDKKFDKILVAQTKIEDKNELKFTKIEDAQNVILEKLTEIQGNSTGKTEISKGKMLMYGAILVAAINVVPYIIALFVK